MTETADTATEPTPAPAPAPARPCRRLERSTDDRVVAGVCGGLAAHLGIDPILLRVLFVVGIVFAAPVLLPTYLALWIFLPPEGHAQDRESGALYALLVAGAVLIVVIMLAAISGIPLGSLELLWVVLIPLVVVLLLGRRYRRTIDWSPPAATGPPTAVLDADPQVETVEPQVPAWWHAPPPRRPRRPRPSRSPLTRATLGVALLVAGVALLVDAVGLASVRFATAEALALATVGCGMLVGVLRGRARLLVPVAVLLGATLAVTHYATVPAVTAPSSHYARPDELTSTTYRALTGGYTLDLRHAAVPEVQGISFVDIQTNVGHVLVLLPADLDVIVDAAVGLGRLTVDGRAQHGVDLKTFEDSDSSRWRVHLRARVGIGQVEVRRASS